MGRMCCGSGCLLWTPPPAMWASAPRSWRRCDNCFVAAQHLCTSEPCNGDVLATALSPAACSVSRLLECKRSAEGLSPSGKAGAMRNGAHAG